MLSDLHGLPFLFSFKPTDRMMKLRDSKAGSFAPVPKTHKALEDSLLSNLNKKFAER